MEIRDPIHGTLSLSDEEAILLDSLAFQRLRQIKQLGFSEFSFPGATHNRYLHSVGAAHVASQIFDGVFHKYIFSSKGARRRLRQCLRLAVFLHDIGHGPLSHASEEVMPPLKDLRVRAYKKFRKDLKLPKELVTTNRQANHEDYTIKFITDSSLTKVLRECYPDISPLHIACLIDKRLEAPDDFFIDQDIDFRAILSQIVSSELDADRLDYLERDAYFCGTNYGRIELEWLLTNLTFCQVGREMFLALNRRALYSFDDFLLARHHMNLMVYFHHKAIMYEEMLMRYLTCEECTFRLPADIEEYIQYTDYALYQHLRASDNEWAKRISERRVYRVLFEMHTTAKEKGVRSRKMRESLEAKGIPVIFASSSIRLSKYHGGNSIEKDFPIFVVDLYDRLSKPYPIEQSTEIFHKYDEIRRIERLYVPPEMHAKAEKIVIDKKL
jgi:HD superfamily phosphohydrolase